MSTRTETITLCDVCLMELGVENREVAYSGDLAIDRESKHVDLCAEHNDRFLGLARGLLRLGKRGRMRTAA